jgi:pyruvate/2-oxoglutarate dehydrogenase complex dihydrolipoamide dehydrogenase (E3) component
MSCTDAPIRKRRSSGLRVLTSSSVRDGVELALTHREILQLRTLPKTLVVIGGGVIALAFAIRAGFTAQQLAEMLFVFPGLSQVVEYAVRLQPSDP